MTPTDPTMSLEKVPTRTARCPAKINLALSVGPPLESGLHPISSWMVTINLTDDLALTCLPSDRTSHYSVSWHDDATRTSEIDWPIESDLAVRAHRAVERHVGRHLPVQMKLQKRIPVGGGLGGGSSNAASMLMVTNDLFELGISRSALATLAHDLGSDVPYFLGAGSAVVGGLGEQVRATSPPPLHAVIVVPEFGCSTGEVYREFDTVPGSQAEDDRVRQLATERSIAPDAPFNDLTSAALRVEPRLRKMMDQLSQLAQRPAHLCGSGSTLFIICDDVTHAEALAIAIKDRCSLPALPVHSLD